MRQRHTKEVRQVSCNDSFFPFLSETPSFLVLIHRNEIFSIHLCRKGSEAEKSKEESNAKLEHFGEKWEWVESMLQVHISQSHSLPNGIVLHQQDYYHHHQHLTRIIIVMKSYKHLFK